MKIIRPFLLFVSIILFGWLFFSNADLINIMATLNHAESNSEISKINSFTDINELKQFAVSKINQINANMDLRSESAVTRSIIILILIFIQIVLYATKGNIFGSKTSNF